MQKYILYLTIFIFPLLVVSRFANPFEAPKLLLLLIAVFGLIIISLLNFFKNRDFEFNTSKFDFVVLLFLFTYLISGIFASPNFVKSFFIPGTALYIILGSIFYFFLNQTSNKNKQEIITIFVASAFILSIVQILSFFGLLKAIPFLPEFVKSPSFNLFGNSLNSIVFIFSLLPVLIYRIIKHEDIAEKTLSILIAIIFTISLSTSIYSLFIGKENSVSLLSFKHGWPIAVDALKVNPILGVGPANFSFAYNKFRPIQVNLDENWNLKYLQNSSSGLNMITETGLLGFSTILLLAFVIYKKHNFKSPLFISILIVYTGILTLPLAPSIFVVLFLMLSIYSDTKSTRLAHFDSKVPQTIIATIVITLLTIAIYTTTRVFYAEILFTKAINELAKGQGVAAYDFTNKAISLNKYSEKYHLTSATINLVLAEKVAEKKDLTDEDKQNISALIQQSIREAKAAVAVNKTDSNNWEGLSDVYRKIMSFAKGSDVFAIEALNQAIALDPINPILRIKLGSLYYSLQKYDLAIDSFKLATLAKPDLPNAHYNLAIAYKETKQFDKAKESMNKTLTLLGKNSTDYDKALKELQNIEELTKPEEKTEPVIEPQIEIPSE